LIFFLTNSYYHNSEANVGH